MGYGKRFGHMIRKTAAPSPESYTLPSTNKSQSFSFGLSREKFQKVYLKENPPHDISIPGPGSYNT